MSCIICHEGSSFRQYPPNKIEGILREFEGTLWELKSGFKKLLIINNLQQYISHNYLPHSTYFTHISL